MSDTQRITSKEGRVVYSKSIKAGKRIYYLDVRKNRRDELFLTITESRRVSNGEGMDASPQFEKHKLFLYKEDFDCFMDGMIEVVDYVKENNTVDFVPHQKIGINVQEEEEEEESKPIAFSVDF